MDSTTYAILKQIGALGWAVKIFRINGDVELHAVGVGWGPGESHVSRCNDGDGEEELYRAARLLAEAVGIDLEDG